MARADPPVEMFSPRDTRSAAALRSRYHELIKLYHPDTHADHPEWAARMARGVIVAYTTLKKALREEGDAPTCPDLPELIRAADQDVRRAVLLGWLLRLSRDRRCAETRGRIAAALDAVLAGPVRPEDAALVESSSRLYAAFLDATDPRGLEPQPYSWRTPHVFHDLRLANGFLDKGIRDFYYYRERGRLRTLGGVAHSYLADASRFYACVSRQLAPGRLKEVVQSRILIARLFQRRIRRPDPA